MLVWLWFYLHSMFNHIDLVETTNQLPGFCVLTLLAIYEWLKIFFLYELVRHIMNIDARSGPEYPKPLYKVYFFSETSFDRALQVKYFQKSYKILAFPLPKMYTYIISSFGWTSTAGQNGLKAVGCPKALAFSSRISLFGCHKASNMKLESALPLIGLVFS